jgi:hypothetical protein
MSSDLIPIPLRQLGRAGLEKLPEFTCSVEYASTFHCKDLPSRIKVIFIFYGVA